MFTNATVKFAFNPPGDSIFRSSGTSAGIYPAIFAPVDSGQFGCYRNGRQLFEGDDVLLTKLTDAIKEYGQQNLSDPELGPLIPSVEECTKEAQAKGILEIGISLVGGLLNMTPKAKENIYQIDVGATVLGLNKRYLEEAWKDPQTAASVKHLKIFIEQFVSRTGSNHSEVIACLGFLSGAYEKELVPGKCDFSAGSLKKICTEP